jgi:NAD(P)-dependent dehydrogenase (short-subunit alcohol dehydrogenase family)
MTMPQFNAQTTAEEVMQGIDLQGKTVVVTGSSAGLGAEAVRVFARAGATVLMAARAREKNQHIIDSVSADLAASGLPPVHLEHITLDLSDLNSVRAAAAQILANHKRIDILLNNAGIMACPLARTAEGCELQFGTNHIGHFLLTALLVPALKSSAAARIVNLSSNGHRTAPVDFDDPQFERRHYEKWLAYGQAKTANILFSVGLSARLQKFGITANAVHPGMIHTELGRHLVEEDIQMLTRWTQASGALMKTVAQGAATEVWAAVSPALATVSGRYFEDCQIAAENAEPAATFGYMPYALDPQNAERLWHLSEQIVGRPFNFD